MVPTTHIPIKDRAIDFFVCFGHTLTGLRQEVVDFFTELKHNNPQLNIVINSNLNPDEYQKQLQNSKICIDAWGAGDVNARFFEAIAAGCYCIYQRPQILFNTGIEPNSYSTITELKQIIQQNKMVLALKSAHASSARIERIFRNL